MVIQVSVHSNDFKYCIIAWSEVKQDRPCTCNVVVRSPNSCQGNATMRFVYIVELCITVNNIKCDYLRGNAITGFRYTVVEQENISYCCGWSPQYRISRKFFQWKPCLYKLIGGRTNGHEGHGRLMLLLRRHLKQRRRTQSQFIFRHRSLFITLTCFNVE